MCSLFQGGKPAGKEKMNSEFAHMSSLLKELREEALQRETQGELEEEEVDFLAVRPSPRSVERLPS